jgi:hypothetical protein
MDLCVRAIYRSIYFMYWPLSLVTKTCCVHGKVEDVIMIFASGQPLQFGVHILLKNEIVNVGVRIISKTFFRRAGAILTCALYLRSHYTGTDTVYGFEI